MLLRLLDYYAMPYLPHGFKPHEIKANCPFCTNRGYNSQDQKYRLGLNTQSYRVHCFRCDYKQNGLLAFARDLARLYGHGFPFTSQQKLSLHEREREAPVHADKSETNSFDLYGEPTGLPGEFERFTVGHTDAVEQQAWRYLQQRGVTALQVATHGIGYCGAGRYGYRVVFPVWGPNRAVYGFAARTFVDAAPKYLNSLGQVLLFNGHASGEPAVETEGVLDALRIERWVVNHLPGGRAVATLGGATTPPRLHQLGCSKTVLILPDRDLAGVRSAMRRAEQYRGAGLNVRVYIPTQLDGRDPAQWSDTEVAMAVDSAQPWSAHVQRRLRLLKEATHEAI